MNLLTLFLFVAAAIQCLVAVLNLFIPRILDWGPAVRAMPLLIREVFRIHLTFISITLLIFAVLTGRFAAELASGASPMHRWFAAGIAVFWAARVVVQFWGYSAVHWRGQTKRTLVHVALIATYSFLSICYAAASFR